MRLVAIIVAVVGWELLMLTWFCERNPAGLAKRIVGPMNNPSMIAYSLRYGFEFCMFPALILVTGASLIEGDTPNLSDRPEFRREEQGCREVATVG
jgi:hypothetical protein